METKRDVTGSQIMTTARARMNTTWLCSDSRARRRSTSATMSTSYTEGKTELTIDIDREDVSKDKREPRVKPSLAMDYGSKDSIITFGETKTGRIERIEVRSGGTVIAYCDTPAMAWIWPRKRE